jgi:hypothetical protein
MPVRVILLVVIDLVLAASVINWGGDGRPQAYRQVLVWGLALDFALLARLVLGKLPAGSWRWRRAATWAVAPWILSWIVLDLGVIGVAYLRDWVTFTYGDQALAAGRVWLPLWALPLSIAAGLLAERGLRAGLWRSLTEKGEPTLGAMVSAACGVALALPAILPRWQVPDPAFVGAALVTAVAREVALILVYRRGGLLPAGGARGILIFVEAYALNDWYAAHFPAANYVSSEPAFYAVRALAALAGAGILTYGLRRRTA